MWARKEHNLLTKMAGHDHISIFCNGPGVQATYYLVYLLFKWMQDYAKTEIAVGNGKKSPVSE
jgi:hypothetical protein